MDFKLKSAELFRTVKAPIATATVIEAGDLVTLSSGLIVKAGAASTSVAYAPNAHPANSGTSIDVSIGNDFTLIGQKDADAAFAEAQYGALCDVAGTTDLIIDNDTASTNVLQISISKDAGVIGSKKNIEVKIAKPIF